MTWKPLLAWLARVLGPAALELAVGKLQPKPPAPPPDPPAHV
jgi:hypothetical protein